MNDGWTLILRDRLRVKELKKKHRIKDKSHDIQCFVEMRFIVLDEYTNVIDDTFDKIKISNDNYYEQLSGKTGKETIPLLEKAISLLGDDEDEDRHKPTEGNVKKALTCLLEMAKLRPNGFWNWI